MVSGVGQFRRLPGDLHMQKGAAFRTEGFELLNSIVWVFVALDHRITEDAVGFAESAAGTGLALLPLLHEVAGS